MPVKDKGQMITTEREQAARWVQHFEEVLNRPDPEKPADPPPSESYLDISTSPLGIAEVRSAIENMKTEKPQELIHFKLSCLKRTLIQHLGY